MSLPGWRLAAAGLHHIARMLDAQPTAPEAHASLVQKIVRFAAWSQVLAMLVVIGAAVWLVLLWRRRRRRVAGAAAAGETADSAP